MKWHRGQREKTGGWKGHKVRELVKDTTNRNLGKQLHQCKICGTEGMFETYLVKEMVQDSHEEFEYFVCARCSCLQIVEIPTDLGRYYGSNYYSFAQEEFPDFQYKTPVTRRDKILDVGCGSGTWLFRKALSGFGNLHGCDPFLERNLHYGDRIHIQKCSIHEIKGENSFDEIRISDAFEHMTDPVQVLKSAARLLKPGAVLAMDIPVFPNAAFDMFGPYWFQIDAPRHIFLHSKESLRYLEEQSGMKVVKMEYDADYSWSFRSFFYSMGVPFYEQTRELISRYFTEEDIRGMIKTTRNINRIGCSDHAKVYWTHRDADENAQTEACRYARENEECEA